MLTRGAAGPFRWAVAERPCRGTPQSGDAFIVVDRPQGPLVAVLDGLGHGPEAARGVRAGADALRRHCHDPLALMLARCATAVETTRGVVATVCSFDHPASRLTWAAVGNVAGIILDVDAEGRPRRREVVQLGGIVGATMPRPHVATVGLHPGALLVLATDGIDPAFRQLIVETTDPGDVAPRILSAYGGDGDDSLVLVGRYEPAGRSEDRTGER